MSRLIKIGADGAQLPPEATGHVAVLDTATQLMWSVEVLPRAPWKKALKDAAAHALLGHSDWHLPSYGELTSLVDITRYNPAIDPAFFPDTPSSWFWTSSPDASAPAGDAWLVGFNDGGASFGDQDNVYFVRPVRSVPAASASQ